MKIEKDSMVFISNLYSIAVLMNDKSKIEMIRLRYQITKYEERKYQLNTISKDKILEYMWPDEIK